MTTTELRNIAANLPLHDPARAAVIEAVDAISYAQARSVGLQQALAYANAALATARAELLAAQSDRANLICALVRIAYGVGSADDYSRTAKDALAEIRDAGADSVDNPAAI